MRIKRRKERAERKSPVSCSENFTRQEKSIVTEDNQAKTDGETYIFKGDNCLVFDEATAYPELHGC